MDPPVIISSSKKGKHSEDQGTDKISNLPENVLYHILSFLSILDVIRMSVLPRRWLYTWISTSNIDLEYKRPFGKNIKLLEFVDRVLTLHDGSDIKRLRLRLPVPGKFPRLNKWISVAINHNVQELDLFVGFEAQYPLPCWLFTSRSLIVLKIYALLTFKAPSCTFLLNLKKLRLSRVTFSDDQSTQKIFSSCPVLHELALVYCNWGHIKKVTISISTLKSLTIYHFNTKEVVLGCTVKISSINLTNFKCSSDLKINIDMCELPFLDSAFIEISNSGGGTNGFVDRAQSLFSEIYNVRVLKMTPRTLMHTIDEYEILDQIPAFYKLIHLKVRAEQVPYGSAIIKFLQKTPLLEHLDIFESDGYDFGIYVDTVAMVPSCFNSSLKMFSISYFGGSPVEMDLLEFVLKNASALQCMIINCNMDLSEDRRRQNVVKKQLNKLPKVSKSCVIEWCETS